MTRLMPVFWMLLGVFFMVAYMAACEMPAPADAFDDDDTGDPGDDDDAVADDDDTVPGDDDDTPSAEYPSGWTYDFVVISTGGSYQDACVAEYGTGRCVVCEADDPDLVCLVDALNEATAGGCEFVAAAGGGTSSPGPAPRLNASTVNFRANWFRCPTG